MHTIEAIGMYKKRPRLKLPRAFDHCWDFDHRDQSFGEKEYVERIRSEDDRRVVKLGLTKKGKLLYRVHQHFHREMVKGVLSQCLLKRNRHC